MKIDEIPCWEAFLAIEKQGNFSKAAQLLKVPVPQISKRISKLERQLGVRLFQRTTRAVKLTDEGKCLIPKISTIIEDLRDAESLFESAHSPSGKIKVTCVPFVAHKLLLPVLDSFMRKYPKLHIELELSEHFLNIVEEGFDIAIRIETPKDTDLVYRKLAPNDLVFCASPKYLKKNKSRIRNPDDLESHDLLMLSIHKKCRFRNYPRVLDDFKKSKKIVCENGVFLTDMALNGFGVLVRSIWDVQDYFKKGELIQVLKKHPLETFGFIHAVVPSKRYLAPRVRTFLDFILRESKKWTIQ